MSSRGLRKAVSGSLMGAMMILPIGCVGTTATGTDAGCRAYSEARLYIPPVSTISEVPAAWAQWIADTDDRMTGVCRD